MSRKKAVTYLFVIALAVSGFFFLLRPFDPPRNKSGNSALHEQLNKVPTYRYSIDCGQLQPQAMAIIQKSLYVSYRKHNRIDLMDLTGKLFDSFELATPEPPNIIDIAGRNGKLYFVDAANKEIWIFDRTNRVLSPFVRRNVPQRQYSLPVSVVIHQKLVFIADLAAGSVQSFSNKGDFINQIKTRQKNVPLQPASVNVTSDGRILISDIRNKDVAVFSCNGKFIYNFSTPVLKPNLKAPGVLKIDGKGRVHVVDTRGHRILMYDNFGRFLAFYTLRINEKEAKPSGLAIDKGNRRIFIGNYSNNLIEVWEY